MQYNKGNTDDKATKESSTRGHSSTKRPRAPIACYRCHHKKVRCDSIHPNCTRCLSTGILCAYPNSRRSRNTQPSNIDPFINNLSQLEAKIRRIETDLESQRTLVQSICGEEMSHRNASTLNSNILQTEKDLQESRSIVAQLRLFGERRTSRNKRASKAAEKAPLIETAVPFEDLLQSNYYFPTYPDLPFAPDESFQDWSLLNTTSRLMEKNDFVSPLMQESMDPLLSFMTQKEMVGNKTLQPARMNSRENNTVQNSNDMINPNTFYNQFMNTNELLIIDPLTQ